MTKQQEPSSDARIVQEGWTVRGNVYQAQNQTIYVNQPPADTIPDPPSVLPCLANRNTQVTELETVVDKLARADSPRVTVCLVPGYDHDNHDALMQRYREVLLPRALTALGRDESNRFRPLSWPDAQIKPNLRMRDLKQKVRTALGLPADATTAQLHQRVIGLGQHFTIRYNIYARNWRRDEPKLLADWINSWVQFPPLPTGRVFMVFICLHLESKKSGGLLGKLFKFSNNALMEKAKAELCKSEQDLMCLSLLESLGRDDVAEWATTTVPNHYEHVNASLLESLATKPFDDNASLPLDRLIPILTEALYKATNKPRGSTDELLRQTF